MHRNVLKLDTIETGKSFGEACFLAPYLLPFIGMQSGSNIGSEMQLNIHDDTGSEVGDVHDHNRTAMHHRSEWTNAKSIDILEGRQVTSSSYAGPTPNYARNPEGGIFFPPRGDSESFTSADGAIHSDAHTVAQSVQPYEADTPAGIIRAARRFSSAIFHAGGETVPRHSNDQTANAMSSGPGKGIKRRVSIPQQMTGRIYGLVERAEKAENGVSSFLADETPIKLAEAEEIDKLSSVNNVDFIEGSKRSNSGIIDMSGQNSSSNFFRRSEASIPGLGYDPIDINAQSVSGSVDDVYYQPYTIIATTYTGVRFLPQTVLLSVFNSIFAKESELFC
jgi:hypothetical protein